VLAVSEICWVSRSHCYCVLGALQHQVPRCNLRRFVAGFGFSRALQSDLVRGFFSGGVWLHGTRFLYRSWGSRGPCSRTSSGDFSLAGSVCTGRGSHTVRTCRGCDNLRCILCCICSGACPPGSIALLAACTIMLHREPVEWVVCCSRCI
jgi:hypothetical protein